MNRTSFFHSSHGAASPRATGATAPEISVILTAHDAPSLAPASIASVLAQSFADFELIVVVDPAQKDAAIGLAAPADPRIRIVAGAKGGLMMARNTGVKQASAPLVAFMKAGDLWAPHKLSWHIALHRDEPHLAGSHDRIGQIGQEATSLDAAIAMPDAPANVSHLVVRRDWFNLVGGFDTQARRQEDNRFLARIFSRRGQIAAIDAMLTGCRAG